jgi:hypothetical protein
MLVQVRIVLDHAAARLCVAALHQKGRTRGTAVAPSVTPILLL